uniref:Ig-like domain-containing protein n=1 Tax=Chrysemys picta bellii TaxID=8478 RepID=A0A8C3PEY0_CHRPI
MAQSSGRAFTLVSQLTVPASDLAHHTYQCSVEHTPSRKKIDVEITNVCEALIHPEVRLLGPSCERNAMEKQMEVVCLLLRFSPHAAKVEWLVNGEKRNLPTDFSVGKGTDGTYMGQSRVNITKESWEQGDVYTCQVTHPARGLERSMHNTSKCLACLSNSVAPSVYVTEPSYDDLIGKTARVTCLVLGYSLVDVRVVWEVDGKASSDAETGNPEQANGTQSVTSTHKITLEQWKSRTKFTCKVRLPCFAEVTQDMPLMDTTREGLVHPEVRFLGPSCERNAMEKQMEVVCLLLRFSPHAAKVEWLVNGEKRNLPTMDFSVGKGTDGSYMGQSRVNITKESWEKGDVYTCKVTHPAWGTEHSMHNTSKCLACLSNSVAPSVYVTEPSYDDLIGKTARVTCLVLGYSLVDVWVAWEVDGKASSDAETGNPEQANGTQSVTSTHKITLEQWKSRTKFTCKVRLPCFAEVTQDMPLMDTSEYVCV